MIKGVWLVSRWEVIRGSLFLYVATGLLFAACHKVVPGSLDEDKIKSNFDYIYFSFTCLSTTGFGDISPKSELGKLLSIIESLLDEFILLSVVVASALALPKQVSSDFPPQSNRT